MVPNVPGTQEASEMYKDLNGLTKNRPLTNFIYASYLQPGVAEKMDALGYRRSSQGQHRANDIYNYFEISKFKEAVTVKAQSQIEGFSDSTGTLIDFDSYDAYVKAQTFNNANAGRVAYVVQHGNKFNILIDDKDSRTQIKQAEVNRALVQWNSLSEELASQGFDINELAKLNPTLVNPGNVQNFVKTLNILGLTPNDGLSTKALETSSIN